MIKTRALGLLIAGALLAASGAHADQASDMAAFQNFRLTDDFLTKYLAVQDEASKDPCSRLAPLGLLRGDTKSLDQAVAAYDAQPGVHAMLARHGLTAREAILGMVTLMAASLESARKEHADLGQSSGPPISPANLAFYKAHEAALQQQHQHLMVIGRQQLAANHGRLPACMRQ